MSDQPLPMEVIEQQAADCLTEEPMFGVHEGLLPADGLLHELEVLQEAAEDQLAKGRISRDTRLGVMVAIAGLRDSIRKAQDDDPGGGEDDDDE